MTPQEELKGKSVRLTDLLESIIEEYDNVLAGISEVDAPRLSSDTFKRDSQSISVALRALKEGQDETFKLARDSLDRYEKFSWLELLFQTAPMLVGYATVISLMSGVSISWRQERREVAKKERVAGSTEPAKGNAQDEIEGSDEPSA